MSDEGHHLGGFVKNRLGPLGQAVAAHGLGGKVGQHHRSPPGTGGNCLLQDGQPIARLKPGLKDQHVPPLRMIPKPNCSLLLGRDASHTQAYF